MQINVAQTKSNKFTQLPWLQIQKWLSLFLRLFKAAHNLTWWLSGKRVWLSNQRTWIDSPVHTYFQCVFFLSFSSILMLNCFKLVKWHHQKDRKGNFGTFYFELCMKPTGLGFNLALLKEN